MRGIGQRRRRRRGNVMIEFGLAFPLLFAFLAGMFQFGYSFYVYNELQSAIRSGARYAATADFDSDNGGANYTTRVRNMVVYGTLTPGSSSPTVVPGLVTGNVNVGWQVDGAGIPQVITVNISDFTINTVWGSLTLSNKPRAVFIYLGQFVS